MSDVADPRTFVTIRNVEQGAINHGGTTFEAYETVWRPRGWDLVDEDEATVLRQAEIVLGQSVVSLELLTEAQREQVSDRTAVVVEEVVPEVSDAEADYIVVSSGTPERLAEWLEATSVDRITAALDAVTPADRPALASSLLEIEDRSEKPRSTLIDKLIALAEEA